jgi:rhodanese-related sulfurtransferase
MNLNYNVNVINNFIINKIWYYKKTIIIILIIASIIVVNLDSLEALQQHYRMMADYGPDIVLSSAELKEKKDQFDYIIDVRTPEEFKLGHVKGAINIDHQLLLTDHPSVELSKVGITRTSKVLFYCRSGRRSGLVMKHILDDKYKKKNMYTTTKNYKDLEALFETRQDTLSGIWENMESEIENEIEKLMENE